MKLNIVTELICALLSILLVYTAITKLFTYSAFKVQASHLPFIKIFIKEIWLIPVAELFACALLTVNSTRLYGFYLCLFLLLAFTCYVGFMLLSGKHLPCACGGVLKFLSWKQHLLFNVFFLALSVAGVALEWQRKYQKLLSK